MLTGSSVQSSRRQPAETVSSGLASASHKLQLRIEVRELGSFTGGPPSHYMGIDFGSVADNVDYEIRFIYDPNKVGSSPATTPDISGLLS